MGMREQRAEALYFIHRSSVTYARGFLNGGRINLLVLMGVCEKGAKTLYLFVRHSSRSPARAPSLAWFRPQNYRG